MNCKHGEVDLFLFEVNPTLIEYQCESRKVSEFGCTTISFIRVAADFEKYNGFLVIDFELLIKAF